MKKLVVLLVFALLLLNVPVAAAQGPGGTMSPEEYRSLMLRFVDSQEAMNQANVALGGAPVASDFEAVRQQYRALGAKDLVVMMKSFPDLNAFATYVAQLEATTATRTPSPTAAGGEAAAPDAGIRAAAPPAPTLFTPAYPVGGNYDTFTATLSGFGLLYDSSDDGTATNDERCDSDGEAAQQIALATEKVICELAYIAADAAPADALTVAGRIALFAGVAICTAVVVATEITIAQCSLQDGLVDSSEIEATYENSKIISGQVVGATTQLETHDTEIKGLVNTSTTSILNQVVTTEGNLSTQLDVHDVDIKNVVSVHDSDIKTALAIHDADIKAKLDALSAQLAGFQDQVLQIEIEKALADSNDNRPVSYFYLPAANGGLLELVRMTVEKAIQNNQAAGLNVGNSMNFFGQGDQNFAAGKYKDAYDDYGKAYRELTK